MSETRNYSRSRSWLVTINNWTEDDLHRLKSLLCRYIIVCAENAPTTGTPHIHALLYFNTQKAFSTIKKAAPRGDVEKVLGTFRQAKDYVTKDGVVVWERGEEPAHATTNANSFKEMVEAAKNGTIDTECLMYCRYEKFFQRFIPRPQTIIDGELNHKNLWIYGPPGTGKSRAVRKLANELNMTVYEKLANKWWDGYYPSQIVLIEDLDPTLAKVLTHHIKIWADRYPFMAEIKGGSLRIIPNYHFIVTSNYSIEECFEDPDLSAIKRRFDTWEVL